MKVIIHTTILDKTLYVFGIVAMIWGIYDIYQEYPEDRLMPLDWQWKYHLGDDKKKIGNLTPERMREMEIILKELEKRNPIRENTVIYPRYYRPQIMENPERCK